MGTRVASGVAGTLAVIASSLFQATAVAARAEAQPPRGDIAFVSDRSGDSEIYLIPAGGGLPRNLTNHPGQDAAPSWSSDGSRLAFASTRDGTWDIFVMRMADGAVHRVTDGPGAEFDPSWSPGAGRIVYEATVRGRRSIRTVAPTGAASRVVVPPSLRRLDLDPQWWSPSGPDIVFNSDRSGGFDLWVTRFGGEPRPLTKGPGEDFHPTLASDGRTVAFERARGDDFDLYLFAREPDRAQRLTSGSADDVEPAWSPDGGHVAFVSDRDGNLDLYVVDTTTRRVTNLTRSPGDEETTPAWRPASRAPAWMRARPAQSPGFLSCPGSGPYAPTRGGTTFVGHPIDEWICGGGGDDRIWGNAGGDWLAGDAGRDALWGGGDDDQLFGGSHVAGLGADRLYGQQGDDRLWASGDRARDCLWGGPGNDRARLSLGRGRWSDNHPPAPWGERRCGALTHDRGARVARGGCGSPSAIARRTAGSAVGSATTCVAGCPAMRSFPPGGARPSMG